MNNKILVVAAHPDDEILGLGGTVRKYVNAGYQVKSLILGEGLTSRAYKRREFKTHKVEELKSDTLAAAKIIGYEEIMFSDFPDNRFDSVDLLDIIKHIEITINKFRPGIVFTHHHGDLNIDHVLTHRAVLTATRPIGNYCVNEIYAFETPSSTEYNFDYGNNNFSPNVFIDIEGTLNNKLEAMKCYTTELCKYPHPRSIKALEIIAQRWGTVAGLKYAEPFMLIRKTIHSLD